MILAGDVGGTWTRLALLDDRGGRILAERRTRSSLYGSLEAAIAEFLGETGARVTRVGIGIAGPVVAGACKTTNLPWVVTEDRLRGVARARRAVLVNDLAALGIGAVYATPELRSLANGVPRRRGATVGILAAGTGLGEASLVWTGDRHHPLATEGGHSDFAPQREIEDELLRFARQRFDHVSYERFVSGPGLGLIYDFFLERAGGAKTEADVAIAAADERNVAIVRAGLEERSHAATLTLGTFVDLYGAEAGNLALRTLSQGGVYVAGGIAGQLLQGEYVARFMRAFVNKGRMKDLAAAIPVAVVLGENVAIFGAAHAACLANRA